jgi:ribosomal protein L37AE/L43A
MGTSDLDHAISVQKRHEARVKGYVGEACPECGDFYMVRRGTGLVCEKCGATTEGASPESELPVAAVARPTTDEIKEVFFKAMCAGYAGDGSEKTTISELPGSKVITFKEGLWLVTDVYFVSPGSNFSHGTTAIYHDASRYPSSRTV